MHWALWNPERNSMETYRTKSHCWTIRGFKKDSGIAWLTTVSTLHPNANCSDLTQLAWLCASGIDSPPIESGIATQNLASLAVIPWMQEIVQLVWPGQTADTLYFMKQGPRENPKSYMAHKKLLAIIAQNIPYHQGNLTLIMMNSKDDSLQVSVVKPNLL